MRFCWLLCRVVGTLRQICSVEICRTISWLLAIDVSMLSAISGYSHRRKSSALGSQAASCTFVLIFALCLFAGIKRARGDKVAGFSPLPASRFCTKNLSPWTGFRVYLAWHLTISECRIVQHSAKIIYLLVWYVSKCLWDWDYF